MGNNTKEMSGKMRDTIMVGSIAGVIATTVMTAYKGILMLLGFQFYSTWDTAAKIFLHKDLVHTPIGYLTAFLGQYILGSLFGVAIAFTLRYTGKDYYLAKGIGVGSIFWLGSVGFFMKLLGVNLPGRSHALTNFLTIIDFILLGTICSFFISRYSRFEAKDKKQ